MQFSFVYLSAYKPQTLDPVWTLYLACLDLGP